MNESADSDKLDSSYTYNTQKTNRGKNELARNESGVVLHFRPLPASASASDSDEEEVDEEQQQEAPVPTNVSTWAVRREATRQQKMKRAMFNQGHAISK